MKLHQRRMRTVESALQRLATQIGHDVLFLPISIVDEKTCGFHVACIDRSGIKITEQCIDEDPLNIEVYIAHEIFHEVVEDESLLHVFPAKTLNFASDFKINQYLQEFFGYNVLAVKFKGLRDKRFDNLTVEQICALLPKNLGRHFTASLRHPIVSQLAKDLRTRLGITPLHNDFIKFNYQDAYYHTLRRHYSTFEFANLPNINPDVVVRHLWVRHFQFGNRWNHEAFGKHLTHSQALSILPNVSSVDTEGDPELSMFAALFIVNTLNNSERLINKQIKLIKRSIENAKDSKYRLQQELRHCRNADAPSKTIEALKARILNIPNRLKNLRKRLAFYESLPNLKSLLLEQPSVRVKRKETKWECLSSAVTVKSDAPRFDRKHEMAFLVNLLMKLVSTDLAELDDLYHKINDFTKDFAPDNSDDEEEVKDGDLEDDEDPGGLSDTLESIKTNDESESESETEKEQNQSSTEAPSGDSSESLDQDEHSDSETDSETGSSLEDEPEIGDRGSGGQSKESPQGNGGKLETLNTIAINPKVFRSILKHAYEFGEKLMVRASYKASDSGLIDRTLTFGTDLSRLPSSELGRLGNDYAKLSFLVDLANGNLLQYADLDPRRGPLVLMLDCSGSMTGKYYEIAAGFCLTMIQRLNQSQRGVMLIKFSSGIDSVHVWDKGARNPTLSELLKALATPSLSGTDFDDVLKECFRQVLRLQWKNSQGLLISDGQGSIEESTIAQRPTDMRLTGVLTTKKLHLLGFDDIIHATRTGLAVELTAIGNSIL